MRRPGRCTLGVLVLMSTGVAQTGGEGLDLSMSVGGAASPFAAWTVGGTCVGFTDLAQLPVGVWPVRGSDPPVTVFVATPCHNVIAGQTTCATFVTVMVAPAFQQSLEGHTCYGLGDLDKPSTALIDPHNASAGLLLTYNGGTPTDGRPRALRYRLACDPSAPAAAGPTAEAQIGPSSNLVYGVTWATPHACSAVPVPATACPPIPPPPPPPPPHAAVAVPTTQQLAWQDLEVGAMLGFNLQSDCRSTATHGRSAQPCLSFSGATGNSPAALSEGRENGWVPSPPTVAGWDPAALDTDAWAAAAKSFGAKYVMLVAQHMAGFSLWDTKAHNFSIANTAYKGGGQDVVKDMVASCKKHGLKLGFFYSVHFNWWLGVNGYEVGHPRIDRALPNLTQAEFLAVAKAQLTELADRFGPEGPVEIWFDGGTGVNTAAISPTVMRVAPGAVCHSCEPNFTDGGTVRWMGNEAGVMPLPSWGSGSVDNGDPLGSVFSPPSCDAVLREHLWFFANNSAGQAKGVPTSTLGLVRKWLTSVGRAANLILNVGPDGRTGAIPASDVARYAEMGAAVACLFSQPLANTSDGLAMSPGREITWKLPSPISGNVSIVIREDQRAGQLIGEYSLWCGGSHGMSPCEMATLGPGSVIPAYHSAPRRTQNGIGHKRILLMALVDPVDTITLKIEVSYAVAGQIPALRDISLFDWGGKVRACV